MAKFDDELIPIRQFLNIFKARWYWFLISLTISFLIAILVNRYSTKIYSNSIKINLNNNIIENNTFDDILLLNNQNNSFNFSDNLFSLTSFPLILETVKDLNFNIEYFVLGNIKNSEAYSIKPIIFEPISLKNNYGTEFHIDIINQNQFELSYVNHQNQLFSFGETIETSFGSFRIILNDQVNISKLETYPDLIIKWLSPYAVTKSYINKLKVRRISKFSSIVEVSSGGEDLLKETLFLNKLASNYIKNNVNNKNKASINTIRFIDEQLFNIKDTLDNIETQLQVFKSNNSVIELNVESEKFFKDISTLQDEKSKMIVENKYLDYLSDYLTTQTTFEDIIVPTSYGISNPMLNRLISDLVDMQLERNVLNPNGNLKNPILSELDTKIEKLKFTIINSIDNLKSKNKLLLSDLTERINSSEEMLSIIPKTERQLINIERHYELSESIYLQLMNKRIEASIKAAGHVPDAKVIESAIVQSGTLIAPNKKQNLIISLLFGLLFPLSIVIFRQLFNNKIFDTDDVKNKSNIPFMGIVSRNHSGFSLIIDKKPKSRISESFRNVRSNIEFIISKTKSSKVILFTSSISGEGKTFCALNLATLYAKSDKKTLLIGADLRKPKMFLSFSNSNEIGLSLYLSDKIQHTDKIIFDSHIKNLHYIPSGPLPPNPSELVGSDKMKVLISKLKDDYDYIVIDTAPIFIVADALPLMEKVDLNLFVTRQNFTKKELLNFINNFYDNGTFQNLALLLNDVDFSNVYGYKYAYDYEYYLSIGSDYYSDESD